MALPTLKKILIIRLSSIGDIVLTTPVIRCVKRQYPNAALHFLVKKSFKNVVVDNPYIDQIHTFDKDLNETITELKAADFDCVIDLHHNVRTLRIKKALAVKQTYAFPKLNVQKWMYVNLKMRNMMPDVSIVERYFEAVKPIGVVNDGKGLDFFIPESKETQQDDIPMGHWVGYVACVIGGSKGTKQLPATKWQAFIKACPYPVILIGGPDDKTLADEIMTMDDPKIYNSCGKFNLIESADLVKRARVVVSNDTGLMHIAAAFKKKTISLWGNTTPELGMFPYFGANNLNSIVAPESYLAEVKNLSCRPCSKIGYDKCPKGHFKCMNQIDTAAMAEKVVTFWN